MNSQADAAYSLRRGWSVNHEKTFATVALYSKNRVQKKCLMHWVLRDNNGMIIGIDRYLEDLLNRHPECREIS